MTVGELVGFIDLEDKGFASELGKAERSLDKLQSTTSSKTASMESTVTKSFADIERAIEDGLDPAAAIADLDRLERELDQSLADMLSEADDWAAELEAAVDEAFDSLDDDAKASGRKAGKELADGLDDGLKDAPDKAREHGRRSGEEFGDGVEGSGGGSSRMAGIGANLIGGLKAGAIGLALAAGAAIGAKIMEGIEGALDAQKAKQKLFAQLGTTQAESKRIGKVAGQVFADAYGESMDDVTAAIKSVVQNIDGMGQASESTLKAMSERAMDTATVLDEDVSSVTRAVAQILRNDLAPNAKSAFDLLVKGAQEGANKSEDLLDTFNEYGTQFRELGLSGKEALGLISQGLKAGARDADTVADALKEFAIRAQDGSETSRDAFDAIGLDADKMFKVFSEGGEPAKRALGDVLERIRGIEDPVKRNAVAVGLFGTKAEDMQDALLALDPTTAVDSLGQVKGAADEAGRVLNDTAENKLTAFKRGLEQNITNTINESVMPALEKWAGWFQSGPMAEDLEELKGQFSGLFDDVSADVEEWLSTNQDTLGELKGTYEETFGSITSTIGEFVQGAKEFWDEWGSTIMSTVAVALQTVTATIGGFFETLKGIFLTIKGVLTGDWRTTWEGIKSIAEGMTRGAREGIEAAMREITASMGRNWDQMKSQAGEKLNALVTTVKGLPDRLVTIAEQAKTWLLQAGRDLIAGMIRGVQEKAGELVAAAQRTVQSAVDGAKNLLGIKSPSKVFHEIGVYTIQGMINGASSMGPTLAEAMRGVVDNAVASARASAKTQMDQLTQDVAKWRSKQQPKPITISEDQIAPLYGVAPLPSTSPVRAHGGGNSGTGGVTVKIENATVREEADFNRLGAQFGFEYMAHA
jgi:phage-related minor tail protein